MGLLGDQEGDKTGDVNANLWAGIVLLVIGGAFLTWAWLRPVVVTDHVDQPADGQDSPG
jgi:hypothetical protein